MGINPLRLCSHKSSCTQNETFCLCNGSSLPSLDASLHLSPFKDTESNPALLMRLIFITQCLLWSIITHLCHRELIKTGVLKQKSEIVYYYRFLLKFLLLSLLLLRLFIALLLLFPLALIRNLSQMFYFTFVLPDHFMLYFLRNFFSIFFTKTLSWKFLCLKRGLSNVPCASMFGHN